MRVAVELRCEQNPSRLFGKALREAERPLPVTEGNLLEFACPDCRKFAQRNGEPDVVQVFHRFDVAGTLVETEVVRSAPV